jgi:hypothetical protein
MQTCLSSWSGKSLKCAVTIWIDSKPAITECCLCVALSRTARMTSGKIAVSEAIERALKKFTDNGSGAGPMQKLVVGLGSFGSRLGLTIAGLFLAAIVHATEIESLTDKLPRAFIGEFIWDGDKTVQNVVITFEAVRALSGQDAEAVGCGAYEVNRQVTKIKVRMLVTSDLQVEILEQSPQGSTSFETEGSHRGNLSNDLQRIDARWTSRATGQRGQLHLRAATSAVCAPAASL